MLKALAAGSVALALFAYAAGAASAEQQDTEHYRRDQVTRCHSLMRQFDRAKTKNAEALALRKRAGKNCNLAEKYAPSDGIAELERAMKLIGVKPI